MGVNETEIDKILNEVEELRKELTSETSDDVMAEFRAATASGPVEAELTAATLGKTDPASDMEATLATLKDEASASVRTLFDEDPVGPAVATSGATKGAPVAKPELKVVETAPVAASPTVTTTAEVPGELTMTLSGSMSLKLKYQLEGQEVLIAFVDGMLKVELADGSEFKVPLSARKPSTKRKVS